jgi:Fe2+ or Zn2+ uptake regulation protein
VSHHLEAASRLQKAGHRLTPQRMAVLEIIKGQACHMSVNEVVDCLKPQYPTLTVPTVYRILQWLKGVDLVAETDLGDGHHIYEYIAEKHHHHLVCAQCQRVVDLPDSFIAPLREAMQEEYGFQPCIEHLGLFGVCPQCQERLKQQDRQWRG